MCIEASVGEGGTNAYADVVIVQLLLNLQRPAGQPLLPVDGRPGPATFAAIRAAEAALGAHDGRIDPGGPTLAALARARPRFDPAAPLLHWLVRGVMPLASPERIDLYLPHLHAGMAAHHIDTALRQAHFLAQLGHESLSFRYTEEIASGTAYEGRADLGNTRPGDGERFKGRGLIQLTGRRNYTAYGHAIGRDLTEGDNPKLVAKDPALAVDAACWFWSGHDLNRLADADQIEAVTRVVNGGINGLADRTAYLRRAKFLFNLM